MKLMLTLKQRSGLRVIEYLDERGRGVIRVPLGAWRAPQRELGGIPHGGASQVARFAMMLVDARPRRRAASLISTRAWRNAIEYTSTWAATRARPRRRIYRRC